MLINKIISSKVLMVGLLAGILTIISGCSNTPSLGENPATDTELLTQSGNWKVSYYWDKDKDETSDFSGYTFEFKSGEVFQATFRDGAIFTGRWFRTTDDGLPRLVISITGNKQMEELSDDWVLEVLQEKKIELRDDNDTHVEQLHFVKN